VADALEADVAAARIPSPAARALDLTAATAHGGVSAGTKVAFYRVRLARRRKQPIQRPITCVM
jgi:hypothetical protein